jgi:Flp pilus assembly protein TadG
MRAILPTRSVRQRGSVAIELAGVFIVLVALLMPIFLIGRVYFHYNIVTNAANLAARYAARGTSAELQNGSRETGARALVAEILTDAGITTVPNVRITCQPFFCNTSVTAVQAVVQVDIPADQLMFPDGLHVNGSATVKYP